MDDPQPAPPRSGVWAGKTQRIEFVDGQPWEEPVPRESGPWDPIRVVLHFQEETVDGYGFDGRGARFFRLRGSWGSAPRLQPAFRELAELSLWESGRPALHLILRCEDDEAHCYCWLNEDRLAGFWRLERTQWKMAEHGRLHLWPIPDVEPPALPAPF